MIKKLLTLTFSVLSANTIAFDSSWIRENVHDKCTFMESKEFVTKSEEWDREPNAYGAAIGATNALVDSNKQVPEGWQYNVSYYNCPSECLKSGASETNGMLGKEKLLGIIGYKPIECIANLVVPELLRVDFDNDGFEGYALRYKTVYGGNQGQRGWLYWDVAFVKNSNGELSLLNVESFDFGDDAGDAYYHKLLKENDSFTIQFYVIKNTGGYDIIDVPYYFNDGSLIPSS